MITSEYPYVLVMPDKRVIAVEDIEYAKAFVNRYYERRLTDYLNKEEYREYDTTDPATRETLFIRIGQDEGEPMLYDTDSVIEGVRESSFFEDEKEEIIKKLLISDEGLDADKYNLDIILVDLEPKELLK